MNTNENLKILICKDNVDPDPELLVWEKWIKIRKEETTSLAQKTNRTPGELAMNLLETVREEKERKIVLENAKIEKKVGVRKTPWEQPARLKQKCYCKPAYELHRTRAELGRPRVMEHIGVPRYIQENEKGINGVKRKPCNKLDSNYNDYRDKKEKDLESNIKKIDPYRPEIENLIVIGNKPTAPLKKIQSIPSVVFTPNYENNGDVLRSVYAIRINNTIFVKDFYGQNLTIFNNMQSEIWHENCSSWLYYFNCPVNRAGRSKLFLHNIGTVTLRYCWKRVKREHIEDNSDQVFFFNKNENIIFPGQKCELFLTFISTKPGIYSERWELLFLNVCFLDNLDKKLIIDLSADSVENITKTNRKIQKIENIISHTAAKNMARNMLSEIVIKATSIEPQSYPYKKMLLEAEMFIMKNPVCFYHQTEVMKLKDTYKEMAPEKVWDLGITSWRSVMVSKEFNDRMKYYDFLRNSHRECLKPWYEGDTLLTEKYKALNEILGQMADNIDKEYYRIPEMFKIYNPTKSRTPKRSQEQETTCQIDSTMVRNIFYIRAYDHVASAIEVCAGILSSLDLNNWIDFDFCRT